MSTTLTNGLKLPDKGSVDWYADMQNNYTILNGAVGTIAEHTSALAGKAPLVHTHTKSDITDFPAYGNTAGTICEGNDSRLSDARTPVAHTHTKADVTNLFNSANTWSADNIYTYSIAIRQNNLEEGALPVSNQTKRFRFTDKNDVSLGWLQHTVSTSGDSYFELLVANKFSNGQLSTQGNEINNRLALGLSGDGSRYLKVLGDVYPDLPTRVCNLGTSTNQWNNLYAKNYYYNGTAWGLDKQNEWTNFQRMTSNPAVWYLRNSTVTLGSAPSSNRYLGIFFEDVNGVELGNVHYQAAKNGYNSITFSLRNSDGTNTYTGALRYRASATGAYCFFPETSECDLGISTNKFKTLNGINPGALSLPDTYTNIDTTNWNLTGTLFNYTPPIDGWLFVNIRPNNNYAYVALECPHMRNNSESTTGKNAMACIAVRATVQVSITLIGASIAQARLVTCAGNV